MTKISNCKFEIAEHSPEWHNRYNYIIDEYIRLIDSGTSSAISSLSEDDCISLAINLAKIDPNHKSITWPEISNRLNTLMTTSVPDQDTLTVKVFLPFINATSAESEILFSASQYTWADPDHMCFTVINVRHEALRSRADIQRLESRAKDILRWRVKAAFHFYQSQRLYNQGNKIRYYIERIKMNASKACCTIAGVWL